MTFNVTNLIEIWIAALAIALALFLGWGASIHDGGIEDRITGVLPLVILSMAVVVSVLQVTGVISTW